MRVVLASLALSVAAEPCALSAAEQAGVPWVSVDVECDAGQERIIVENGRDGPITVVGIGSAYRPRDAEPFRVERRVRPGRRATFTLGRGRGPDHLSRHPIIDTSTGEESIVVETDKGTIEVALGADCPIGMARSRIVQTASRLSDGRILFAGGDSQVGWPRASAEIYDPGAGGVAWTSPMTTPRSYHTATVLADGRVFLAGGLGERNRSLSSTEIYDPASGRFSKSGSLTLERAGHHAVLLGDGRVLLVGNELSPGARSAEIWDPATGESTPTAKMRVRAKGRAVAELADGSVLVVGGCVDQEPIAAAETFDVATGAFTRVGDLTTARCNPAAVSLEDGRALIVGGELGAGRVVEGFGEHEIWETATAEVYDPATRTFHAVGDMSVPRSQPTMTRLTDGRVVVAGGCVDLEPLAAVDVFDPTSESFQPAKSMLTPRCLHAASRLDDGRVLLAGGWDQHDDLRSAEFFRPPPVDGADTASTARRAGTLAPPTGAPGLEPGLWRSAGQERGARPREAAARQGRLDRL